MTKFLAQLRKFFQQVRDFSTAVLSVYEVLRSKDKQDKKGA